MKYKHIEAAREARLWTKDIVVPLVIAAYAMMPEEKKRAVIDKMCDTKDKIKQKFNKQ